jgi:ketosteroid isomerase-like protein
MRFRCITAVLAILTGPLFAEQTDRSGWQYDAVVPEHLSDIAGSSAADINAINDLLAKMAKCWNQHDLPGYLSALWNSSQLIVVLNSEQYQGWDAVNAAYRKGFPDPDTMGQIRPTRTRIRITKSDLALAQTEWGVSYPNSNSETIGTTTLNLQKFGNDWKVISEYTNYVKSTSRGWEYDSIEPPGSLRTLSPDEDDLKAINDLLLRMLERWNAHDIDGYLSVYWRSPQLLVMLQEQQFQGWQSLYDTYKTGYPDPDAMGAVEPSRIQIKLVKPDVASAVTWWTVTYRQSKVRVVGNSTMNLQKFADGWKIVLLHSSYLEP